MIDLVFLLLLTALLAWVANLSMAVATELREARARVRRVRDRLFELETELDARRRELDAVNAENDIEANALPDVRRVNLDARRKLVEVLAKSRARLFIQSDRRISGDREWIVVIQNPRINEIDPGNPSAPEWLRGRAHLIWAESAEAAAERVVRRLSTKPGFVVKSVELNTFAGNRGAAPAEGAVTGSHTPQR